MKLSVARRCGRRSSPCGGGPRRGRLRRRAGRAAASRRGPARPRTRRIRRSSSSSRSSASRPTSSSATSRGRRSSSSSAARAASASTPSFARQRTGLRAVNIALSCARPEAAWGYLNWFYQRWPDAKVRWVWGMQSGMLRDRDLDPALLQDRRFYPLLPRRPARPAARAPARLGRPRCRTATGSCATATPRAACCSGTATTSAGPRATRCDQALDAYIARMLHTGRTATEPDTRARAYFERHHPAAERARHHAGHRAHAHPPARAARDEGSTTWAASGSGCATTSPSSARR